MSKGTAIFVGLACLALAVAGGRNISGWFAEMLVEDYGFDPSSDEDRLGVSTLSGLVGAAYIIAFMLVMRWFGRQLVNRSAESESSPSSQGLPSARVAGELSSEVAEPHNLTTDTGPRGRWFVNGLKTFVTRLSIVIAVLVAVPTFGYTLETAASRAAYATFRKPRAFLDEALRRELISSAEYSRQLSELKAQEEDALWDARWKNVPTSLGYSALAAAAALLIGATLRWLISSFDSPRVE